MVFPPGRRALPGERPAALSPMTAHSVSDTLALCVPASAIPPEGRWWLSR